MPRAPKKCGQVGCNERITGKTYCPDHEAAKRNASTWGRGSTRQSRKERELVLNAWPHCYLGYEGCTVRSTEDDHVIPKGEGGTDDLSNRRGACRHCHKIKSQREAARARRRRFRDPSQ
jgi:5-methylcytosine-specific restriction protein A